MDNDSELSEFVIEWVHRALEWWQTLTPIIFLRDDNLREGRGRGQGIQSDVMATVPDRRLLCDSWAQIKNYMILGKSRPFLLKWSTFHNFFFYFTVLFAHTLVLFASRNCGDKFADIAHTHTHTHHTVGKFRNTPAAFPSFGRLEYFFFLFSTTFPSFPPPSFIRSVFPSLNSLTRIDSKSTRNSIFCCFNHQISHSFIGSSKISKFSNNLRSILLHIQPQVSTCSLFTSTERKTFGQPHPARYIDLRTSQTQIPPWSLYFWKVQIQGTDFHLRSDLAIVLAREIPEKVSHLNPLL
jgi:hypothetical protein